MENAKLFDIGLRNAWAFFNVVMFSGNQNLNLSNLPILTHLDSQLLSHGERYVLFHLFEISLEK